MSSIPNISKRARFVIIRGQMRVVRCKFDPESGFQVCGMKARADAVPLCLTDTSVK